MTVMPGSTWFSRVLEIRGWKGEEELKSMAKFMDQNRALRTASVSYLSRMLVAIVDMHGLLIF